VKFAVAFLAFGLGAASDSLYHYLRPAPTPIVVKPQIHIYPKLPGMEFCT